MIRDNIFNEIMKNYVVYKFQYYSFTYRTCIRILNKEEDFSSNELQFNKNLFHNFTNAEIILTWR